MISDTNRPANGMEREEEPLERRESVHWVGEKEKKEKRGSESCNLLIE